MVLEKISERVGYNFVGPNEFASAPGLLKALITRPQIFIGVDEFGDELGKLHSQKGNPAVANVLPTLKKLYNCWEIINTGEKVDDPSMRIVWSGVNLLGAATAAAMFSNIDENDVAGGFVNRHLTPPHEATVRPKLRFPSLQEIEPTDELIEALLKLPRQTAAIAKSILERKVDAKGPPEMATPKERLQFSWSREAEEFFTEYSDRIEEQAGDNPRRDVLSMRAQENVGRIATNIAYGCHRTEVSLRDVECASWWVDESIEAAIGGVEQFTARFVSFAQQCEEVLAFIRSSENLTVPKTALQRANRSAEKAGNFRRVVEWLQAEGRIKEAYLQLGTRGPLTACWRLVVDGEGKEV
jgi:hypothetical protein